MQARAVLLVGIQNGSVTQTSSPLARHYERAVHRSGPDSERLRLRRRRECCDSDTSEFHVHQLQQRQFQKLGEHSCGGHRAGDGKRQRNTRKLLTPVYGAAGLAGKVLVSCHVHFHVMYVQNTFMP